MSIVLSLKGQTALVTGGSRGIGKSVALRLAEAGARVIVASRNLETCNEAVAEIKAAGGVGVPAQCDLSDTASLEALIRELEETFGLDILICNAGNNPAFGPMSTISERKYDRIFDANLKGNFQLCNLAAPLLARSGQGVAVVFSSISALTGCRDIGTYAIAKAALLQMVKNFALEWGPQGVRINAVSPGLTRTDLGEVALQTEAGARLIARTPLGRAAEPEDVADVTLFLASDLSKFMTGQNLIIDGGVTVADYS